VTDELCWLGVRELTDLVRRREISVTELVTDRLRRIAAINPALNAIVTLDEDGALRAAAEADQALATGEPTGALFGLPLAIKDTNDTAGMRTTYGSPLFAEHVPERDDLPVARVRAAGAVLLGKTNVPEFGAGSHSFNRVFGVARNPYDFSRTPGGSTGGTAAALAAGLITVGEGSDFGGSLRNPAAFCNVVGLRPSPGRVPVAAASMGWQNLVMCGPMGRTVDDVGIMLSVLAGPDPSDPLSITEDARPFAEIRPADLTGLRVAYSPDLGGRVSVDDDVLAVFTARLDTLAELGADLRLDCPDLTGADEAFRTLRAWTLAHDQRELLDHRDQVKASLLWNIEQGLDLTGAQVAAAMATQTELFQRTREFFTRYDLLVLPTSQVTPFPVNQEYPAVVGGRPSENYLDWMASSYDITMTSSPALSLPAGFTPAGLPVGLQLVGPYRSEARLLALAATVEAATGLAHWHPNLTDLPTGLDHWAELPPA
jgi:amidase